MKHNWLYTVCAILLALLGNSAYALKYEGSNSVGSISDKIVEDTLSSRTKSTPNEVMNIIKNRRKFPYYVLVSAHRGYWADYPENSLDAFRMAVEAGADIVEKDVRLTKDNVMVVFHDACLDKMTNGIWPPKSIHLRTD